MDRNGRKWFVKMGVEPKIGENPLKWMVYFMENPIKIDDLGETPLFLETPRSLTREFKVQIVDTKMVSSWMFFHHSIKFLMRNDESKSRFAI